MLVRHTLYYMPAQVIAPLTQLVSILVWAHLLTPEGLGVVTLVIAMQELAFVTCYMWWSHYSLRYLARFKEVDERNAFLRSEFIAIMGATALQTAAVWPIVLWYFPDYMTLGNSAVAACFLATRSLAQYFGERSRADTRIGVYTMVQTLGPVGGLLIGLGLMAKFGADPEWVFVGFILAQAASIVGVLAVSDFGRSIGKPDGAIFKRAFSFGVPVMGAQMLAVVALNAPRFIVNHALGLAATGMFAVGYGLGIRASSFAVMLVTAGAYPLVVRKMETEGVQAAYEQLGRNMVLVALAVMPVAFGLLAVNHAVVDIFVAEPVRAATYAVLPLTTIGGLFRSLRAHTTDQIFLIRQKPNYAVIIAIIDLTLAVTTSYVGLYFAGLTGAAAGPMAAGVCTLVASFLIAILVFDFRMPVRPLLGVLASAAVMGVAVYLLPVAKTPLILGVEVAFGAAIYGIGVVALVPACRNIFLSLMRRAKLVAV